MAYKEDIENNFHIGKKCFFNMCSKILLLILILQTSLPGRNALKIGVSRQTPTTTNTTITPTTAATSATLSTESTTTSTTPTTTTTTTTSTTTTPTRTISTTKPEAKKTIFINVTPTKLTTMATITPTTKAPGTATNATPTKSTTNSTSKATSSTFAPAYYCACDLLPQQCDTNCCCDHDCNAAALLVFNCDTSASHDQNQQDINYHQYGLPSCKVNDGWLCVFRTNIIPKQQKQVKTFNFDTTHRYKWPQSIVDMMVDLEEDQDQKMEAKNFYRLGALMKVVDVETLDIQTFELPYAFHAPFCSTLEPIRYLHATERTCLVETSEDLQENKRKLYELLTEKRILTAPKQRLSKSDLLSTPGLVMECSVRCCMTNEQKEHCQDVDIRNLTENDTETDAGANNFYIKDMIMTILHNYTNIHGCLVVLKQQELNYDEEVKPSYWQNFVVNFNYHNYSIEETIDFDMLPALEEEKAVSGPLGYNLCAPVIIARKILSNDLENEILNYYHKNSTRSRSQHSLRLLAQQRGFCHKTLEPDYLISYGVSAMHQCSVTLVNNETLRSRQVQEFNFTDICVQLQELAQSHLLDENLGDWATAPVFVSQLGRPGRTIDDKWLRLQVENNNYSANIVGEFYEDAHSFVCRNILLSVAYEFHFGTFNEQGVPHQGLIKKAVLRLGQRHDLEFELNETLAVPLSMSVMFYDLNSSRSVCLNFINNLLLTLIGITNRFL